MIQAIINSVFVCPEQTHSEVCDSSPKIVMALPAGRPETSTRSSQKHLYHPVIVQSQVDGLIPAQGSTSRYRVILNPIISVAIITTGRARALVVYLVEVQTSSPVR